MQSSMPRHWQLPGAKQPQLSHAVMKKHLSRQESLTARLHWRDLQALVQVQSSTGDGPPC